MKLLITGDFCPRSRTAELIESRQYEQIFGEVKPLIEAADYSLINFECPAVENPKAAPIPKCGPNLRCTRKTVEAITYAGFKGVTLANNHVLDFGAEGLEDTIKACKETQLDKVGADMNLPQASATLYKTIGDKKIAFINCCEHEFSIATETSAGANPLNPVQQWYAIREARQQANYVIVIVHGGHEHYQLPSPRMQETYRFFVDAGADAVINHHQHCYSGYEVYQSKPIFYGLGNFCFDNVNHHAGIWTEGYMVELSIKDELSFQLIPYVQCADAATVTLMTGEKKANFDAQITKLNKVVADAGKLKKAHEEWMDSTAAGYKVAFTPYNNRYLKAFAHRGWIPSFLSREKILVLINYIECEAHRDRILKFLYRKIK